MQIFFSIWCVLCIFMTVMPFYPSNHYVVRGFEFPILQIAILTLIGLLGLIVQYSHFTNWQWSIAAVTLIALIYQSTVIFPYTFLATPQVEMAEEYQEERSIKILSSNVLIDNRESAKLQALIREKDPDIVLLLEPDEWWEKEMDYLVKEYSYTALIPLDNAYGLLLYSRFALEKTTINYLIESDVPSVFTQVKLPSGETIKLYCVHPKPPSPSENEESTERDAELLLVAKINEEEKLPSIVVGDLNDVAWSKTTRLFQKIGRLLDPRIGRRPYATFSADYPIMSWPLDHVFHSEHFQLVEIARLSHIGSDHYPIYIQLALTSDAVIQQNTPKADQEEEQEATEKIKEGKKKAKKDI